MKNLIVKIILITFVFVSINNSGVIARGEQSKMLNEAKSIPQSERKTLVVYYSLTGNTEIVAKQIATELNADLRKVEDLKPYYGKIVYITGSFAALLGKNGKIKPVNFRLEEYNRIFVGSPVWGWRPVPAINTFISNADFTDKEVVVFVTMGGKTPGKSIAKMCSDITKKGGKIIGSFAIQTEKKTSEKISAEAKENINSIIRK